MNTYASDATFKKRLEQNVKLIEELKLTELYREVRPSYAPMLTCLLKDLGINPLLHMTEIPPCYLKGQTIGDLIIPKNIRRINRDAFKWTSMNSVIIEESSELYHVDDCFTGATIYDKLIEFPDTTSYVDSSAFTNCEIDKVWLHCPYMTSVPEIFAGNIYPTYYVEADSETENLLLETVPPRHIEHLI